jgi:hypothetical protein
VAERAWRTDVRPRHEPVVERSGDVPRGVRLAHACIPCFQVFFTFFFFSRSFEARSPMQRAVHLGCTCSTL